LAAGLETKTSNTRFGAIKDEMSLINYGRRARIFRSRTRIFGLVIMLFVLVLGSAILILTSRQIQNYDEPNQPLFEGSYAGKQPEFDGDIKVVTWNIKFSEEIEQAIQELMEIPELKEADILLLQEMDEEGVESIARALEYNYVYFPASVHSRHGRNFGNAILSKWPLANPTKLMLPHENPQNGQIRIATRAETTIGDKELLVYSVHTETAVLGSKKRYEQVQAIVDDIGDETTHVLVGGDFNTLTDGEIIELEEQFESIGLVRASTGAEPTVEKGGVDFSLDHIFTKDGSVLGDGVWTESAASDHFPVWVRLILD
jgi:endonuclease/exonuclease/phosphatase family metal-dependent hydrolase